jgi:hypothetical protein
MTQSLLDTYVRFNSTLEYLGVSVAKIEGHSVRVIDFTDENQMVRAGERVALAYSDINPTPYSRESLAEMGTETLKRLCVTSYPHVFGQNIPEQVYFQLPDPILPEASLLHKIYELFLKLLSTLANCIPQASQGKRIEDMEMQTIQAK